MASKTGCRHGRVRKLFMLLRAHLGVLNKVHSAASPASASESAPEGVCPLRACNQVLKFWAGAFELVLAGLVRHAHEASESQNLHIRIVAANAEVPEAQDAGSLREHMHCASLQHSGSILECGKKLPQGA
jgi:hypothetical protein